MSKFLYPIYKLKTKSYIKWWLYHKKAGGSGVLSEILEGFSFNLENTLNRKFRLFEIEGNSVQDGSTSPNYEQPIKSAGDNENLFDDNENNNIWINQNGDKITTEVGSNCLRYNCSEGDTFTISAKFDVVNVSSIILIAFYDKNDNLLARNVALNNEKLTLTKTAPAQTSYMYAGHFINKPVEIKLEKGNKASGYSPYGMGSINEKIKNADGTEEQDYSIFVQQPMRSIGNVRDKFVKVNGNWFERHYISRVIFDGTEEWGQNGSTASTGQYVIATTNKKYGILNLLSNSFVTKQTSTESSIAGRAINRNIYITIDLSIVEFSVAKFKAYLAEKYASGNTVYVDYELETPLDLPCTQAQIDVLENLPSTYKEMTIINSEDETPAHLKIQYYKEG